MSISSGLIPRPAQEGRSARWTGCMPKRRTGPWRSYSFIYGMHVFFFFLISHLYDYIHLHYEHPHATSSSKNIKELLTCPSFNCIYMANVSIKSQLLSRTKTYLPTTFDEFLYKLFNFLKLNGSFNAY